MRNYKIKMLRQDKPFVVIGSNVEVSDGVLLVVEPVNNPNNVVVGTRVVFAAPVDQIHYVDSASE